MALALPVAEGENDPGGAASAAAGTSAEYSTRILLVTQCVTGLRYSVMLVLPQC